jgi:hypothetical protein
VFEEVLIFYRGGCHGYSSSQKIRDVVEKRSSGESIADLAREYFRALDRELVEQLYQLYKVDFVMFGYSAN